MTLSSRPATSGTSRSRHAQADKFDRRRTRDAEANGGVAVTFSDGRSGNYDLVVGADGINSALREFAIGTKPPIYGQQMEWRSIAPLHSESGTIQFWLGEGCFFGFCPLGGGGTYGFTNVTGPRLHDPVEGRLERMRARFATFGTPIQDYLATLERDDQVHCGPIEWLDTPQWYSGRTLLIGDAAHASSPMMGQGGSMAVEDAVILSETLHTVRDVETALERFVGRRGPRVGLGAPAESRCRGDPAGTATRTQHGASRTGQQGVSRALSAAHDQALMEAAVPAGAHPMLPFMQRKMAGRGWRPAVFAAGKPLE
jgi:2-polyprenyl-6-methoxyphenol hydroxylase-like FAD-dependent oxidoreductase